MTPILVHFDCAREGVLKTDSSDLVSEGVFHREEVDRIPHLVAFYSRKYSQAETNYEIYAV